MIRDRLIDLADTLWFALVSVVKLVVSALSAALSAAWPPTLTLPRGEEAADAVLVVLVGGGFTVLILHGIYDLSRFFW